MLCEDRAKGVDELSHRNKGPGVSCWTARPLAHPPPLDGSFDVQKHSGVSVSSVRCTLAHRIIHRAGFFPTATCQRQRLRQLTLGLARKASASRRPIRRLPRKGPWFFHPLLRPLSREGGGEAASVPAGLRARRFAEKQYTRRLVRPWALLGGQLCSKWWKMREIRQPRDLAGLRGSLVGEGGRYNRVPSASATL